MIRFTIQNPNSRSITDIEVYRELTGTPILDIPVNPPIQILDGFTTDIIDTTAVVGEVYDYRIRVLREGGASAMSRTLTFKAVSLYGPGGFSKPLEQSNNAALLDRVSDPGLPTLDDLVAIYGGEVSDALGWTDQWTKIKQGSDIYFIASKGYLRIPNDKIGALANYISNNQNIVKGYHEYSWDTSSLSVENYMSILDGRYVSKYPFTNDYLRKSIAVAAADLAGISPVGVQVVVQVNNQNSVKVYGHSTTYGPSVVGNFNPNIIVGFTWFWKPMLKYVKASGAL